MLCLDEPVFFCSPIASDGRFRLDGQVGAHGIDARHGIAHGKALLSLRRQIGRSGVDRVQILARAEVMEWRTDRGAGRSGPFAVRRSRIRLSDAIKGRVAQLGQGIAAVLVRRVQP